MIGTGKYDFPGIRKAGTAGIRALLALTSWGVWLLASPFMVPIDYLLDWVSEWLANRGLVIVNIGAFYVAGKFDQAAFDDAMESGLKKATAPGLSDKQKKAIDDAVIEAFRKFGKVTRFNDESNGVPDVPNVGFRTEDPPSGLG